MKAIILCAGYGERVRPLSNVLPKPLFPIVGRPIIENIIYYLRKEKIKEIGINTHWLGEKINIYLEKMNIKVYISHEPEILGTGGGIGRMRDFLQDDTFIVHNGDVLSNIDIKKAIEFHNQEAPLATLILHNYPKYNVVSLTSNNEIVDFGGKLGKDAPKLAFTGITIMDKKMLNFLPYKKKCSIIDIYIELIKSHPGSLKGFVSQSHYWIDIGSQKSYLDVHQAILIEKVPLLLKRGGEFFIPPKNIYIGKNSFLSPYAKVSGFLAIGDNCVIEKDTSLRDCIVWDNIVVKKGVKADNAIFYEKCRMI
jgi:mannose-1-phosphate guanylyltransferase/phosphomannomutase